MLTARTADNVTARPVVPGLKTLAFQDSLFLPVTTPPKDWTSLRDPDVELQSVCDSELAVLDTTSVLDSSGRSIARRRVSSQFLPVPGEEIGTRRPSRHTDRSVSLGLEAPRCPLRGTATNPSFDYNKEADAKVAGERVLVRLPQPRPDRGTYRHVQGRAMVEGVEIDPVYDISPIQDEADLDALERTIEAGVDIGGGFVTSRVAESLLSDETDGLVFNAGLIKAQFFNTAK